MLRQHLVWEEVVGELGQVLRSSLQGSNAVQV